MKPSITATEALKATPTIRTTGDVRAVLSNVLLALVRKEISATDAMAAVAVTDGMCNSLNNEIKAARLHLDLQRASGKVVGLTQIGQMVINGDPAPEQGLPAPE
jgi:hypothetical protein